VLLQVVVLLQYQNGPSEVAFTLRIFSAKVYVTGNLGIAVNIHAEYALRLVDNTELKM